MTTQKKRERTQNWTLEEKILLLKLCEGKVDVLENKKGDQFSVATKNAAWKEIHGEFVATLGIDRDVHRLKEQWQRMKAQARSEMLDFNQRLQQYGNLANQRQPSEISEEVLKVMKFAPNERVLMGFPNNANESDDDYYEDNPLYLCQTEVKQELNEQKVQIEDSSESFLSSAASNLQSLSRVEFHNKQDFVLNALANLRHRNQSATDFTETLTAGKGAKRKAENLEEAYLQDIVQAKNREYEKRLEIIDEQIRTAKLHRETAEIQKQIAQQQLQQSRLHAIFEKDGRKTGVSFAEGTGENRKDNLKKEIWWEIKFCEERIQYHQDLVLKHKQRLALLDARD